MAPPKNNRKKTHEKNHTKMYILFLAFGLVTNFIVISYIDRFGSEAAIDELISRLYGSIIEWTVVFVFIGILVVHLKKCMADNKK